jgi:adenylylsulfate kinase
MSTNIFKQDYKINRTNREEINGHKSYLIWFTGFSTFVLDGDNIRNGINKDLTFTPIDRKENIRRIAEVGNLMVEAGILTIAAFVSPYIEDRNSIKKIVGAENYIEIYVNASVEECERRDVKGLYKKARLGEIKNMTGISAPYEPPINPDLEIKTDNLSIEKSVGIILKFLKNKLKNNSV